MLRKRRSLPQGHASHARRPLSVRKAPPRRHSAPHVPEVPELLEEETFVSTGDHKQDLILAHAQARQGIVGHSHSKFWIGLAIAVCVLAVFFGWWTTFGFSLQAGGPGSEGLFQIVRQSTDQLKQDLHDPTQDIKTQLDALRAERAAREEAMKRISQELQKTQATGTR